MAWEKGGRYYSRKIRSGGRVRSVYIGGGLRGRLTALEDAESARKREEWRRRVEHERAAVVALDADYKALAELVTAHLLAAGFHTHKRQWRKSRGRT